MFWRPSHWLLLSNLIPSSLGFASWLKCSRRLEEDEIIMNNKVKRAPTVEPVVKLAVYDASGSRVDVPSEENQDSIVWIDAIDSPSTLPFTIRMDPETVKGMADIQYVVETSPFEDLKKGGAINSPGSTAPSHSQPSPTPMIPTVPSPSTPDDVTESSFVKASVGGGLLCKGRRGHARGKNGSMIYELATKKQSKQQEDSGVGEDDNILSEVVAGYSEYHGPVTLTPRILFKRKDKQYSSSSAPGEEL